jgi:hypothetical protein
LKLKINAFIEISGIFLESEGGGYDFGGRADTGFISTTVGFYFVFKLVFISFG